MKNNGVLHFASRKREDQEVAAGDSCCDTTGSAVSWQHQNTGSIPSRGNSLCCGVAKQTNKQTKKKKKKREREREIAVEPRLKHSLGLLRSGSHPVNVAMLPSKSSGLLRLQVSQIYSSSESEETRSIPSWEVSHGAESMHTSFGVTQDTGYECRFLGPALGTYWLWMTGGRD